MAKDEAENVRDVLLSRCSSDAAAFILFYDIYYGEIFSYCVSRVYVRQIAEDFTSATFLTAARNASEFRGKTRIEFADWLYAIATEKINRYLGERKTVEKLTSPQGQDSASGAITLPPLQSAILKLAPREQAFVALRFFENLAVDRIAEITGSKPNAVRPGIAKAIETMKMFDTERQFEDAVRKLNIDRTPDAGHKEKLRAKTLSVYGLAGRKKYRALLYSLAAVVVLITAGLAMRYYPADKIPLPLRHIVKPSGQAVEVNLPPQQGEKTRLEKIKQLAAEKNAAALLEILKGDDLPAKLLAAKYLAELTDSNVADIMKLVAPEKKPAAQKIEQRKALLIKTIDKKTKLPLGNVRLQIEFGGGENMPGISTDSNGQYLLTLPAEPLNQLQIRAAVRGYATMKLQRNFTAIMPEEILFEMPPVSEIGGLVVDKQLVPIENAEVKIYIESDSNSALPAADSDETFETDVNGIWRCRSFPQDACQVWIMITHPDYVSQKSYQSAVIGELENFSYLAVLEKGTVVTGRVFDWNKKPLQATVSRGASYESQNSIVCDVNGEFRFGNLPEEKEIFTVRFGGAAPQIQQVDVGPNTPPIIFNLEPAKTIRARVVDVNGAPLKEVYVRISSWQEFNSLNFETATDANGFFRWTDAPADEVLFDFHKPGYKPISNFEMTSENDYVITLETQ